MIPKIKDEVEEKKTVEFSLERDEDLDNVIVLKAVGLDNQEWIIASIDEDGLHIWAGIDKTSGIPVNKLGHIHIRKE